MNKINILEAFDTPSVVFDENNSELKINGRSLPENAFDFYNPIISWIDNFLQTSPQKVVLHFHFELLSSSSLKPIFNIIDKANSFSNSTSTQIVWRYDKGDEDMYNTGLLLEKKSTTKFTFIEE